MRRECRDIHRGPLWCGFLRRPENGCNQVRLFLRLSSKRDMCRPPLSLTLTQSGQCCRTQASNKTWISRAFTHNTRARKFLTRPSPPSPHTRLSSLSFPPSLLLLCLHLSSLLFLCTFLFRISLFVITMLEIKEV